MTLRPIEKPKAIHYEAERTLRHFLGPLVQYFDDDNVNEIMINSPDSIFIESKGEMKQLAIQLPAQSIEAAARSIMTLNSKDAELIMDARLPGVRVAAALPPVALHGPSMSIRKHARSRIELEDYVTAGGFTPLDAEGLAALGAKADASKSEVEALERAAADGGAALMRFLQWIMKERKNLMVVGGTSSGKTTILSSLLACIPYWHRIITNEDTHELLLTHSNIVQFEANHQANIFIRNLIKLCLRYRPDRIIVGEVRGYEAYDLLDAMNTGHPGTAFTLHGETPLGGLHRMESLIRMAPAAASMSTALLRQEISSAIDYVLFQSRIGSSRGPEQLIALDKELTPAGDYRTRLIYDRLRHFRSPSVV